MTEVNPKQTTRICSADAVVDARGGHANHSSKEQSSTAHTCDDDVQSEHCSFDLPNMDTVFHEVVLRRLRSPIGYESLGKHKPPLHVDHSSFSDWVRCLKIIG